MVMRIEKFGQAFKTKLINFFGVDGETAASKLKKSGFRPKTPFKPHLHLLFLVGTTFTFKSHSRITACPCGGSGAKP